MKPLNIARIAAMFATLTAAALVAAHPNSASAASAVSGSAVYPPTRYTPGGVPEYGLVGQGTWQVAGIVNLGEPSLRIVYDETVPGARDRALSCYYQLTGTLYELPQPGITTGLRQVGYSAHYDGVQFQLWGSNAYVDQQYANLFAAYGLPLILA